LRQIVDRGDEGRRAISDLVHQQRRGTVDALQLRPKLVLLLHAHRHANELPSGRRSLLKGQAQSAGRSLLKVQRRAVAWQRPGYHEGHQGQCGAVRPIHQSDS